MACVCILGVVCQSVDVFGEEKSLTRPSPPTLPHFPLRCCMRKHSWRLYSVKWWLVVCSQPPQQYGAPQGWNAYGNQYQQQPSDPSEYRDRLDKQDVPTTGGLLLSSYMHVFVQTHTTRMYERAYMHAGAHVLTYIHICTHTHAQAWKVKENGISNNCSQPILAPAWIKWFDRTEQWF